ncbi:MAG TPA: hypothetical protein VI455_03570 [Terriglobia bacterium]
MARPLEFASEDRLIERLVAFRAKLPEWFDFDDLKSREYVIQHCVGRSTFRALHGTPPSEIFRDWGKKSLDTWLGTRTLDRLSTQIAYDDWVRRESRKLRSYWKRQSKTPISFAHRRKLVDLLMKEVARLQELDKPVRKRLIRWLHVPLDTYSLAAIRNCNELPFKITKSASMGFVRNRTAYDALQKTVGRVARRARVSPIMLDILLWNGPHRKARMRSHPKIGPG